MRFEDINKPIKCKRCFASNEPADLVLTPELAHYGKIECHQCHRFIDWVTKPEKDKSKRDSAHKNLVKAKQPDVRYCELCLAIESDLPDGVVLHGHHVLAYASNGDATPANTLVVCSECHELVHWRRKASHGTKINDDETTFIQAVDQQRAVSNARDSKLDRVEARREERKANKASAPANGRPSELNGPKHVGDLLPDLSSECPF